MTVRTLLLVPSLFAALSLAPAAAAAAPTPDPTTGAYFVSTGAQLADAVTAAKSTGTSAKPAVIDLDYSTTGPVSNPVPHQFTLDATIVITAADHIRIQSAAQELASTDPAFAAAYETPPNVNRSGAGTVLDLTGAGNAVRGITISQPSGLSTASGEPLVHLGSGASLGVRDTANGGNLVSVVAVNDAPNAVPLSITGTGSTVSGTTVSSSSPSVPAVAVTGSTTISGLTVGAAGTAVDVDTSASSGSQTTTIEGARLISGAPSLIHLLGGSGASVVHIRSSQFRGGDDSTLLDVDGAASGGSLAVDLITSTFVSGGTGIGVQPGGTTTVSALGVLGDGVPSMLACSGSASTPAAVSIVTSAWTGTTAPGNACSLGPTAGRVTDPDRKLDPNTGAPAWNSPLVDRVAATAGATLDVNGKPRGSTGPKSPSATPVDIGADEYQFAAPTLTGPTATNADTQGAVTFGATTEDNDDLVDPDAQTITPSSTITWTFPDGSKQTGSTARFRFTAGMSTTVSVTATDPTGLTATATVVATPDLSGVPVPTPTPAPAPTPTPAPGPAPAPTGGGLPTTVPVPTPTPKAAPAAPTTGILGSFQLVNSRIGKAAKKASGLGKPASNEAGMIVKLNGDATLTFVARTQKGTKYGAISGARFSVAAKAGTVNLRISSTIGKAKLEAGLYRLTLLIAPKSGAGDRVDFSLRIK